MTVNFECIDIGVNLTSRQFKNDAEQVIAAAKAAGVCHMILTGSDETNSRRSSDLCQDHPGYLFSTAGIHPHDAKHFHQTTSILALNQLLKLPHVVAVGECGLDFNRDFSPRDQQKECFLGHLNLAAETGLPLFLHERDAHDEFLDIMREYRESLSGGVVHCFTGTAKQAEAYLDLDLHLGITGWICDERRGEHLREIVRNIPVERLMIETDAPYLAPRDYRPRIKRNEPKYLPHILNTIASCRGENVETLATKIIDTTKSFFRIDREVHPKQ